MTAPRVPPAGPWAPPPAAGAPPGFGAGAQGVPASGRTQVAVATLLVAAIGIVCIAIDTGEVVGWGLAAAIALLAGIGVGLAAEPLSFFRKTSGFFASIGAMAVLTVIFLILWSLIQVAPPFATIPLAGAFVLGLDWRRADRLRPLVTATFFPILVAALSRDAGVVGASIVWMAGAFGAYTLIEADRRASLPRVQPDARDAAARTRTDDLATTLLVAAAVAMLAALLLSVPSCQRELSGGDVGGERGGGSAGEPGGGSPSGGMPDHGYVPDPNGGYLFPGDGTAQDLPTVSVPSPADAPQEIPPGGVLRDRGPRGEQYEYRTTPDGDVTATVIEPDGTTSEWRFHEQEDGLTRIDRLDEGGDVDGTWYYDPDGFAVDPTTPADPEEAPAEPEEEEEPRDWSGLWRALGILVLLAIIAAGAIWWWRRRTPPIAPDPTVPYWALQIARQLDDEGARRGRPRPPDASVLAYGRSLSSSVLADPRLLVLAEVVSDALFSGHDPGPQVQGWAEATWAEIVEQHPPPGRREKREDPVRPG